MLNGLMVTTYIHCESAMKRDKKCVDRVAKYTAWCVRSSLDGAVVGWQWTLTASVIRTILQRYPLLMRLRRRSTHCMTAYISTWPDTISSVFFLSLSS